MPHDTLSGIDDLTGKGALALDADFVVIGAGTAGLPAAVLLARRLGLRVVCLETGGRHQVEETHPLNDVVQSGTPYTGASDGRFRCLGGTSTRWGGALIPFQAADLRDADWPISLDELAPYVAEVEALFGLESGPYADPGFPFPLGSDFVNRLAKWPAFKKRNVHALLEDEIAAADTLQIWLNAHVVEIITGDRGVTVQARSTAGDSLVVNAGKLIIAAGAIETTRLALLLDRRNGGAVSAKTADLGAYFADHLSTEVAEIVAPRRSALNRIIGFRFAARGTMRNIRLELAPDTPARRTLPPGFSHIGFRDERPGGFDVLRRILQSLQRRRPPSPRVMIDLIANAPWLARAVWWRLVHKRLLFPAHSRLFVHVVVEQAPSRANHIGLSADRTDRFGLPLADITWAPGETDLANIRATADLLRKTWETTDFARLGTWTPLPDDEIRASITGSGGIYHPTGSTRMASGPDGGVVDKDLNLFGVRHVQLLSTSVLPTGGGANPTMMLLLLAMRLVDQHAENARRA